MYKDGGKNRLPKPSDSRVRSKGFEKCDTYLMRATTPPEQPYVQGIENPGEFTNFIRGLVRDGYSDNEIAKVIGLNAFRIIKTCWPR